IEGRSLLLVRSPDAPKITKTHGSARWLDMTAKLGAQRGEELVREGMVAPRSEARIERCRQHIGGHLFVDRGVNRPAAFARVGHSADKLRKLRISRKRERRQVEEPGTHHAATPPQLRDLREVEIVPLVLRQ